MPYNTEEKRLAYIRSKPAKDAAKKWRKSDRGKKSSSACDRRKRWKLRKEMLSAYGGDCPRCTCECGCLESEIMFLHLDHVNGGGRAHARELTGKISGGDFYKALKKLGWPRDNPPLRLLCANCNMGRQYNFGKCPRLGRVDLLPVSETDDRRRISKKSLPGERFGKWKVMSINENGYRTCECECGVQKKVWSGNLTSGKSLSCGSGACAGKTVAKTALNGESFGRWTVLSSLDNGYRMCKCECGKEKRVFAGNLMNGSSKSCGMGTCCPGKTKPRK